MVPNEIGRRDRKRIQTHDALRKAALQLSAEHGLQKVTVEDIADAADVSIRTFYDHFPSKEDAIIGFDASRVEHLRLALHDRPDEESPLDSLRFVLHQLHVESREEWPLRMRVIKTNPSLLPKMFASFAVFERAMIETIAQRTQTDPAVDLYPALVTAVATGAFRAVISTWRSGGERLAFDDLFASAFEQLGSGLEAPKRAPVRRQSPTRSTTTKSDGA
jgi:AcrR family transcriptional regulator